MSLIVTLTGMSTSGKSTLAKALTATGVYAEAVSVTTRAMRAGEENGKDYHFVDQATFDQYVSEGVLLEHVRSHHACYGVPSFEVERIKARGQSVVMVLEPEGVSSINKIALSKGENVMEAFVHAGMPLLIERFFERIDLNIASGKPVNFDQEGKRLHVMLSEERGWAGRFQWDLTLINLSEAGRLESVVSEFIDYHENSARFKPIEKELKPAISIECASIDELSSLIKAQVGKPLDSNGFAKMIQAPLIESQARIRYKDGSPILDR
ncbi:GTPase [Pseudomonas putida]|uniref:50S ribosome-binding GTPase n=1 Tax=Pseudomonas putida TaxID=303 RepID=A0A8I1ECB7_PSEPU|nr:GTPase [Pseudomonas putida]MBI6882911.1 50S ribosome-binding GTPase [Pseudomonas putida]